MTRVEDEVSCSYCGRDITEDDEDNGIEQFECDECQKIICDDCCFGFNNADATVCKGCIDEVYPREQQVVEKIPIESDKDITKTIIFSEPIL